MQAKGTKSTVVPFSHADKDHVALASLLLSDVDYDDGESKNNTDR